MRLKNSSGKMYALKSDGSTGPRRLFAAAQSRDFEFLLRQRHVRPPPATSVTRRVSH